MEENKSCGCGCEEENVHGCGSDCGCGCGDDMMDETIIYVTFDDEDDFEPIEKPVMPINVEKQPEEQPESFNLNTTSHKFWTI